MISGAQFRLQGFARTISVRACGVQNPARIASVRVLSLQSSARIRSVAKLSYYVIPERF
jgi:hypothetical protein